MVPNAPHHVILRGNNRRRLFSYPREYRYFLRRVAKSGEKWGVPTHACALMPNHVHLVLVPENADALSSFVKAFAQSYALYRNRRRDGSGKLFEQRYRSIPVTTEEQLAVTIAYIDVNPVRAGICDQPEDHPWTTYRLHAGARICEPVVRNLWTPSPWYLSLDSSKEQRARHYRELVSRYLAKDDWSGVASSAGPRKTRNRFERPDRKSAI